MASLITRGKTYYIQWRVGKKIKCKSLKTVSYQVAGEKLLQFESARVRGEYNSLPTQTPLPEILTRYVEHIEGRLSWPVFTDVATNSGSVTMSTISRLRNLLARVMSMWQGANSKSQNTSLLLETFMLQPDFHCLRFWTRFVRS